MRLDPLLVHAWLAGLYLTTADWGFGHYGFAVIGLALALAATFAGSRR